MNADEELFAWLLRLPARKAQTYFWNYSSLAARKKAMQQEKAAEERAAEIKFLRELKRQAVV